MTQFNLQQVLSSTEALCILLVLGVVLCIVCMLLHSFSPLYDRTHVLAKPAAKWVHNLSPLWFIYYPAHAAFILQWTGKRGDSVLLVGHNGAGKTTLFLQVASSQVLHSVWMIGHALIKPAV